MNRNKIIKISVFSLAALLLLIFSSCKTLPVPKTQNDSLLIIPVGYEKNSKQDWFGHYKINITDSSTGKVEKKKKLPILNGFTSISDLEPGHYKITKDEFYYDNGNRGHKGSIVRRYIRFTMQPNHITVLPYKFVYRIFDESSTHFTMNRRWSDFSQSQIDELLKSLEDYKNFSLWKK